MNVKDYRYIIEIAQQESISQASEVLCITQSALTKFLQRIEKELGIALFFRKNNRLYLTDAGRFYVEKGKEIVRLDYEMEEGMARLVEEREKCIRIGCSMGREEYVVREVLPEFYREYPEAFVRVNSGSTSLGLEQVEKNEIDLALVTSKDYRPGLNYCPVAESHLVLAVPKGSAPVHRAVKREGYPYPVIYLEQWADDPFVQLSAITASGKIARDFFKRQGILPQIRLEVNSVRSGIKAVEAGIGNTIIWTVPRRGTDITYLSLGELNPTPQRMYVAYRGNYQMPEIGRELIRLMRKTFGTFREPEEGKKLRKDDLP